MNKFKKVLVSTLSVSMIACGMSGMFANASAYVSTLSISSNSWHAGPDRTFDGNHYYVTIKPTSFHNAPEQNDTLVNVSVQEREYFLGMLWSYNNLCDVDVYMSTVNTRYEKKVGVSTPGTRCYVFDVDQHHQGFESDYVVMCNKAN